MIILQTPLFVKQIKKLFKQNKLDVEDAIKKIIDNPDIGDRKKGDLSNIRVYKFHSSQTLHLLAYKLSGESLYLIALGVHENFYRDLKKHII
jgi:mRNA-degrading endonuclease RelE of RelBE toxin-antitoxin system